MPADVGRKRGQNHVRVVGIDRGDRSTEIGQGEDPRDRGVSHPLTVTVWRPLFARDRTRERRTLASAISTSARKLISLYGAIETYVKLN